MTLNRSAYCVGQIVGAGLLNEKIAECPLVDGGRGVGLGERESILTVRSGMRAGIENPRRPTSDGARPDRSTFEPIGVEICDGAEIE